MAIATLKSAGLVIGALLVLVAASNALWAIKLSEVSQERDSTRLELAGLKADSAERVADFEAKAREIERAWHERFSEARDQYQKEIEDAEIRHSNAIAEQRAGTLRLRAQWRGCETTAELSAATIHTFRIDEAAQLRTEGAANIVRVAAMCDAQVRGLQRALGALVGPDR